jgi:hypothetical protein
MSARAASWLAWSLATLSMAMFVVSVVLYVLVRSAQEVPSSLDALADLLVFVPFLAFPIVGALIASKRPDNPIGWICLVAGLFWMFIVLGQSSDAFWLATEAAPIPHSVAIDALTQWTWVPPVGLLGIYMILLFPDGRLPSRRWRPLAWFSGVVMVLASMAITLTPGPLEGHPGVRNPFGLEVLEGLPWVGLAATGIVLLLPLCILASALSLVLRYRRSSGEVREQIKWIALAASFVGVVYVGGLVSELVFAPESLVGDAAAPLWVEIQRNLLMLSYAGVPVAIGFAVLKYRLYDIDVVINRALVYGSLTISLAAVYWGSIVVLHKFFQVLTGSESQLAVVASTLAMVALFAPLRRRTQSFIDRSFYRSKYDARKTLVQFSSKLRDETDLEALSDDLVGVVREAMQPAHVTLWLRPENRVEGERGY